MNGFDCACFQCQAQFTSPLPTNFCSDACRAAFVNRAQAGWVKFCLEHLEAPMPGDTVRLRTGDDDAFERAVMADLANL